MIRSIPSWCVCIALAFLVACGGGAPAASPADPTSLVATSQAPEAPNESAIEAVAYEFHTSSDPQGWLRTHSLSHDQALQLQELYKRLAKSGKPEHLPLARSAAMLAAVTFNMNNRRDEGLEAWLDANQAEFMLAQTADEYTAVRTEALRSVDFAKELRDPDKICRFLIVAADASRFIFVGAEGDAAKAAALPQLISDMDQATASLGALRQDHAAAWLVRIREMVVLVARDVFAVDRKSAVGRLRGQFAPLLQRVGEGPGDGPAK